MKRLANNQQPWNKVHTEKQRAYIYKEIISEKHSAKMQRSLGEAVDVYAYLTICIHKSYHHITF